MCEIMKLVDKKKEDALSKRSVNFGLNEMDDITHMSTHVAPTCPFVNSFSGLHTLKAFFIRKWHVRKL